MSKIKLLKINQLLSLINFIFLSISIFIFSFWLEDDYGNSQFSSKTVYLQVMLFIALVLQGIKTINKQTFNSIRITKIDIGISMVFAYILLNLMVIHELQGFSFRLIDFLSLGMFYIVLRSFSITKILFLLFIIVLSGYGQVLLGILQLLDLIDSSNPEFILTGTFLNPGPYAGYVSTTGVLLIGLFLYRNKTNKYFTKIKPPTFVHFNKVIKFVFIVVILSILPILIMAQSRASWLAFIVGALLYLLLIFLKPRMEKMKRLKYKYFFLCLLTIFICIGFYGLYNFKKDSAQGRLLIWKISTNMIARKPFFGFGFDSFKSVYMIEQANYFKKNHDQSEELIAGNVEICFNEILQFIVENGLIGLLLLLIFVFILYNTKVKNKYSFLKKIVLIVFFSIIGFSLFSYPFHILPISFIVIVLLVLLSNCSNQYYKLGPFSQDLSYWYKMNVGLVLFIMVVVQTLFLKQIHGELLLWKKANDYYNKGLYQKSLVEFQKEYIFLKRNGLFLLNYGKVLYFTEDYHKSIVTARQAQKYLNNTSVEILIGNCNEKLCDFDNAEDCYLNASYMVPNLFYPHYLLSKLYLSSGKTDKALQKANYIINKPIKVNSRSIEFMISEMERLKKKINIPNN